jgi:hypothetical protein
LDIEGIREESSVVGLNLFTFCSSTSDFFSSSSSL